MYTDSTPLPRERVPPRARVFYALRLPPALRGAVGTLARSVARDAGGRPVPGENLHITLVFVGNVAARTLPTLERIGASVATGRPGNAIDVDRPQGAGAHAASGTPSTGISLDRLGAFSSARVGWLAPSSPPAWLRPLVDALERDIAAEGIRFDHREFHPHLTLARSCRKPFPERAVDPIDWRCDAFELMRSPRGIAGGRYETLAQWPLDG